MKLPLISSFKRTYLQIFYLKKALNILTLIKLFNAGGARLRELGLPLVEFDTQAFIAKAQQKTGLQDFGNTAFLEPLQILLEACEQEANLSIVGRLAVKSEAIRLLSNRLQLIQDRKTYPEIAQESIKAPLIILGLPRTGSTLLHNLLSQDPANRVPRMWETIMPSPPPGHPHSSAKSRIRNTNRLLKGFYLAAPKFKIVYPMTALDPAECVTMMTYSFMSAQFQSAYHIPSYQKWLENAALHQAYIEHRQFLQHLQWNYQPQQWVLKAPPHIFAPEALLSVYPDAKVIQTHRSPHTALGSVSSFDVILRQTFSRSVNPEQIGQEALLQWSKAIQVFMNFRDSQPTNNGQFYDMLYTDLSQNPIDAIHKMYAHFGLTLTNRAEQNMKEFLKKNPKHKHGEHRYSLSHYGLSENKISSHFKAYMHRYKLDTS